MFKQILASVGIGGAQVDTQVHEAVTPGAVVAGSVIIRGGDVAQFVDTTSLALVTEYTREVNDSTVRETCVLTQQRLVDGFNLQARETRTIPFTLAIPYETPLTVGGQPVYLRTGLEIANAVDPGDTDRLRVLPHPTQQLVLDALADLGFTLQRVQCEYNRKLARHYPFVQEFELRPTAGYRHHVDELELVFFLSADRLEVLLEIDKRARGFMGMLEAAYDLNERYTRVQIPHQGLSHNAAVDLFDRTIQRCLQ